MVAETWLLTIVIAIQSGGDGASADLSGTSVLRVARLFRLTRAVRVARLLRAVPELLILLKGMLSGLRAVFFTILLLIFFIYLFAILFTQLAKDSSLSESYFDSVPHAMASLTIGGILADQGDILTDLGAANIMFCFLFSLYFLLSALTIMNMLLGVLIDVVNVVSAVERDKSDMIEVKGRVMRLLKLDKGNQECSITKAQYRYILTNPAAAKSLDACGIDTLGLVDCADIVFKDKKEIDFPEFLNLMLNLRGGEPAKVKDLVDLRKSLHLELGRIQDATKALLVHASDAHHRQSSVVHTSSSECLTIRDLAM